MTGFIVIDEPAMGLKHGDLHGIHARLGTPKESTLYDGTKVSEYRSGAITVQTAYHEDDGWNWQMKDESK